MGVLPVNPWAACPLRYGGSLISPSLTSPSQVSQNMQKVTCCNGIPSWWLKLTWGKKISAGMRNSNRHIADRGNAHRRVEIHTASMTQLLQLCLVCQKPKMSALPQGKFSVKGPAGWSADVLSTHWSQTVLIHFSYYHWQHNVKISSVQSLSRVRLFATPWIAAHQASLSITNSQSSPRLMSIESVMPSSHLILCRPLLLLPPVSPSIRFFSNESTLHMRWPKYWNFSFSISPSKEIPGLISFRMDWLDLLAVQGTLKSLHQHHSSKASILQRSAFFTVQLSHPYMTTGKTTALTKRTLVGKVMSLLFNMLSRLVITFLSRSKHFLISWLQSPSSVILEPPQKIKFDTVSTVSPSISHEVMGPDAMIFVFWMLSFKPTFSPNVKITSKKPQLTLRGRRPPCLNYHCPSRKTHSWYLLCSKWSHYHREGTKVSKSLHKNKTLLWQGDYPWN